jgi:hypothetical protein
MVTVSEIRENQMNRIKSAAACVGFAVIVLIATSSWAQRSRDDGWGFQPQKHKIEITPYVGYTWTSGLDVRIDDTFGKLDIANSQSWGLEVDVNVQTGGQFTLLYQRQDSDLTFQPTGTLKETLGDISVEHFQIGGIGGVQNGKVMPFGLFTLGATRLAAKSRLSSDVWKFSLMLGFGAKIYLGEHIGIRVQARLPWVVVDGGGALACGGGGCFVSLGGSGFVQPDVGVGLMLLF